MMPNESDAVEAMLRGYKDMIGRFISEKSTAGQFEQEFLNYFKTDENQIPGPHFDILDALFADVDDYVDIPSLRAQVGGVDELELRDRAREAFRRLYGES